MTDKDRFCVLIAVEAANAVELGSEGFGAVWSSVARLADFRFTSRSDESADPPRTVLQKRLTVVSETATPRLRIIASIVSKDAPFCRNARMNSV